MIQQVDAIESLIAKLTNLLTKLQVHSFRIHYLSFSFSYANGPGFSRDNGILVLITITIFLVNLRSTCALISET